MVLSPCKLGQTYGVKVLRIDRPEAGGFLSLTAFQAEGCGLPLYGNAYKVSVTEIPSRPHRHSEP